MNAKKIKSNLKKSWEPLIVDEVKKQDKNKRWEVVRNPEMVMQYLKVTWTNRAETITKLKEIFKK